MDAWGTPRYCLTCGHRLARDNQGLNCTPCQVKARDRFVEPPVVPADFWDAPALQAAFAAHHLGQIIRAYRHHPFHGHRPLSQQLVAGWFHTTQAQLSRIETGPPITDLNRLVAWTRRLGIPPERLWFVPDGWAQTTAVGQPSSPAPRSPSPLEPMPTAGGWPGASYSGLPAETPDLAALQAFRAADRQVGGGHLYATVTSYLQSSVAPRLFGGTAVTDGASVFTAASGFTEMAGWMAYDAGNEEVAEHHFRRSLDLARAGGDSHLSAAIYASLSHLSLHQDKPDAAITFARKGQAALADTPPMPHLAARLLAMQARGLAATADAVACTEALHHAETVLEDAPRHAVSPWISPFDAGSLASEAARCMQRLGHLDEAERHARRIIELRATGHTRSRAFGQLRLVSVLIAKGQPDEACALASDVLTTTQALNSHRVTEQLYALQASLRPYHRSRAVTEFLPCLKEAVHQRFGWSGWLAGPPTP